MQVPAGDRLGDHGHHFVVAEVVLLGEESAAGGVGESGLVVTDEVEQHRPVDERCRLGSDLAKRLGVEGRGR